MLRLRARASTQQSGGSIYSGHDQAAEFLHAPECRADGKTCESRRAKIVSRCTYSLGRQA